MRVVFIVDSFPALSETFILNQITGFIDLGHEVFILSGARSSEQEMHADVIKYGLLEKTRFIHDRPRGWLARIMRAVFLVLAFSGRDPKAVLNSLDFFKYGKEALSLNYLYKVMLFLGIGKIDVMICHYGPNGVLAALMRDLGIKGKIITMFHGYDIRRGIESGGEALYGDLFQKGDCFLSISEYNYKHLVSFKAPIKKICHHPVGIDLGRYAFTVRNIGPSQKLRILTVGRLVPEKGIEYGIKAFHRLLDRQAPVDLQYCIVGDGPERGHLEKLVADLGLKDRVIFCGYQTQDGVIRMLNDSHIFFLPSIAEALPMVLMEAQAVGLPVVAAQVGSVDQAVVPGVSAFLVPPKDVDAMCGKLELLLNDPGQWKKMGEAGRRHVEANFDIAVLNRRLSGLCMELSKEVK